MFYHALRGSVGVLGQNDPQDVLLVQELLNQCIALLVPMNYVREDGRCDPATIDLITFFQQRWLRLAHADGRVDPGGQTFLALVAAAHATPAATGPTIPWGAKVSAAFKKKVIEIGGRLGISPDFLMACMAFESGGTFSPKVTNAAGSGAVGLIQFMPSTARGLGTTTAALAAMSAEDQLDYVEKYFAPHKNLGTLEDVYMVILWPAAIGKPTSYVLFQKPSKAYTQNAGLDKDKHGKVTKFEAAAAVRGMLARGQKFAG